MDDFVGGVTSDNDSVQTYQAAKRILKEGGFNLRKWYTKSTILQEKIIQATSNVSITDLPNKVRVLGLEWKRNTDCLMYNW